MRELVAAALRPWEAFPQWAVAPPPLRTGLGRLLRWRLPLACAEGLLGWWSLESMVQRMPDTLGPTLLSLARERGLDPADIRALLAQTSALPSLGKVWPWLLLAAPLLVLGAWLHHAAWDHGCLWMLGGLKTKRGFRASLEAEAEALTVGTVGAALGLLGLLPVLGLVLSLPLALVNLWFWGLRGFALAARHGCPAWKGVAATGLHLLLLGCCGIGLVGLMAFTLMSALAGAA
ncbi:MAG TPA: hypothetical protein VJ505_13205 [Holophagaceae bacterium]|nr:hypothetical protein [Holophagaceae bacterium]